MTLLGWLLLIVTCAWPLAFVRAPLFIWSGIAVVALAILTKSGEYPAFVMIPIWILLLATVVPLSVPMLRRRLVSDRVLAFFRKILPNMSQTEREAMEAGTVWWDADLFSGKPDWNKLINMPIKRLSVEEQAFLDGPVDELCQMLDDWDITHNRADLTPEVWNFIKRKGFFGMIIPKEYGGLGFSALAHSCVVMKISGRSITAAVTVMVPNSLGPAELLLHYGTEKQKQHYLPRLANGQEVPCFALTGPEAGSDASAMPDNGVVCRQDFDGNNDVLGIRLNWNKRYITLGPVATVLGLAFKLYDPDHLIGEQEELGITVALIPTDTDGITIGRRHNPVNMAFQNGPNSGNDVFIPMDWLIGGQERAGQGWRMLMESLAAGRCISLPALSTGGGKMASRSTGAYARIREQFHMPIGRFEGVEEALARIAGSTYMMDAARTMTLTAVDMGEQPSVISAVMKYHTTERMRQVINDAMDIQGGSGICLGPRNFMGRIYQALPISITVEGANILTRSLIIYGQGALRCHPYVFKEMEAARDDDPIRSSKVFDKALFGHIGFVISNTVRSLLLGLTGSRLASLPVKGPTRHYFQRLTRMSAAFALVSDVSMLVLGGALKRKEKISGRLGDALSYLYMGSAALKRFEDQNRPAEDLPLVQWVCDDALYRIQQSLDGVLRNFPNRPIALVLRALVFPLGRQYRTPSDHAGHSIAKLLLEPSEARDRLTDGMFISKKITDPTGRLEDALLKVVAAEPVEKKIRHAIKNGTLSDAPFEQLVDTAITQGHITEEEAKTIRMAAAARNDVIQVDDFDAASFLYKGSVNDNENKSNGPTRLFG